jgi:hypothetical protein
MPSAMVSIGLRTAEATSGLNGLIVPARPTPAAAAPRPDEKSTEKSPVNTPLPTALASGEVMPLVTPACTAVPGQRLMGAVSGLPFAPTRPRCEMPGTRLTMPPTPIPMTPPAAPATAEMPSCCRSKPSRVPVATW